MTGKITLYTILMCPTEKVNTKGAPKLEKFIKCYLSFFEYVDIARKSVHEPKHNKLVQLIKQFQVQLCHYVNHIVDCDYHVIASYLDSGRES
ncbi:hypothetical protein CR513_11408, partial [Mucuna pruriens]